MKLQKTLALTAAALSMALLAAAPLSAAALAPDTAVGTALEQQNGGYLILDADEVEIEIPSGYSTASCWLEVEYVEDWYSTISWSSSNVNVATVDDNGKVTAWSTGSAIITARTDTGCVGRCLVTVTKEKTGRLNESYLYMDIEYNNRNPRKQLYLTNADRFDGVYQWRSTNPSVASVDRNGVVTANAEGVATIYASTYKGNTLSCTVTVQNNIGRVTLNESRLYLEGIGGQAVLNANIAVENPAAYSVTWTSSNPAVATVDANGLVTAVSEGQAVITANASNGRSDSCKVYTGAVATQKKQEAESFFGLGELFMDLFD